MMNMNGKMKDIFDTIHAEEELKDKTREFLYTTTHGYKRRKPVNYRRFVPAVACLLFLLAGWGGYHIYFTPTSVISVDVNPSVELGINRFDKVISVEGYNREGDQIAALLNVKYMNYTDALDRILKDESIASYLSQDEIVSIAVVGSDEERCGKMLTEIESFTAETGNTHCCSANMEDVEEAHTAQLSYGKYQAYLELNALDPSITPEKIQGMTMREIRDLLRALYAQNTDKQPEDGFLHGEHHGYGNGHGGKCH